MRPDEALQYRLPCPRDPFYELLTIDDHIGLQRIKLDRPSGSLHHARDHEVFVASELTNKSNSPLTLASAGDKLITPPCLGRKCMALQAEFRLHVLGLQLCLIASLIAKKGAITRKLLQALLGCWTHVCLFRRPVFAVFDKIYHEGENLGDDVLFKMSSQTMTELLLMCVLAPVMQADLRVEPAPVLYMLDASPFGGGICKADFSEVAIAELWRHTEQRGYYTKLQQGASMALQELGLEPEPTCGPDTDDSQLLAPRTTFKSVSETLRDSAVAFDCVELFSGFGDWSKTPTWDSTYILGSSVGPLAAPMEMERPSVILRS